MKQKILFSVIVPVFVHVLAPVSGLRLRSPATFIEPAKVMVTAPVLETVKL